MAYSCLKRASKGQGGKHGPVLSTGALSLFGPPTGRCEVMYTANGGKMEEEDRNESVCSMLQSCDLLYRREVSHQ